MGRAIQSKGGTGRSKLLNKWITTYWQIDLKSNEYEVCSGRKRKPENQLHELKSVKCARLEEELKTVNKCLNDATNQIKDLEHSVKRLSRKTGMSAGNQNRKKEWVHCSKQYQKRRRKEVATDVRLAAKVAEDEAFQVTNIELTNTETGKRTSIDEAGQILTQTASSTEAMDLVAQTLYGKERCNILNEAYHELLMVNKSVPRSNVIHKSGRPELPLHHF